MARKSPPSTASTTSTDDQPEATSTSRQTASQHASRRISTPIRTSPLLKSSYGAPPDSFNPPSSSLRMSTSNHSESVAGSTRGSLGGGGSEDSDGESRIGESASVRYARLRERQRNSTVGRNKINGSSLNSTSVNIATAIYQAEQARYGLSDASSSFHHPADYSSTSHMSTASSSSRKETHQPRQAPPSSSSRRGPLPPAPMTQVQAPSSSRSPGEDASFEAERERRRRDRTKSPVLDAIAGTVRALSPVSYLLKPRVAQGGPFPDEDPHADGTTSSNGFQSFGALRSSPTNDGRAPSQDLSFLSVTSGADVSTSSDLALGDRSQDSQASDYAFDEEERLMAEMEAKKARVLGGGGELRKFSEGKANGGWFSGLAGFRGGSLEDEDPADTTPKKKKGGANGSEELSAYEPDEEDEDDQEASDHTSDSYDDDSDPEEEPDKPTKTTSHRRRKISDDAKTYKYRPGESASESDISEGGRRRRRRSSGKVSQVAGAEGMVHVVEGKKRRKKGGRGKNTSIEEGEGGELGYEEDESRDGGMDYNPQPSFREEEDSFIVRFHPGADSPPPSSARSRSTTSNKQPSANQSSSQSHSQPSASWNIISTLSDFTVSIARNALVLLIFTFNTIVSLLSWILHKPLDLLNSIRRSLGMADWSKVSKPLGVTLGVLLLASLLGRRSPDSFPLQDLPRGASWRSHLPSISSTSRSSAPSTFIPPESAEELLDRLAHIESTLGAVSKDGQRSTRDVQTLTTKLLGMEKRLDLTDRSMSSLDGKVGTLRTDVASLRDRVKEAERLAKQALDASKVAKIATDTIEEYLPSRLAVKVNPKTKALEVDPSFWKAMREVFVAHQQLPSSISAEVSRQHSTGRAPQTSTSSVVVPRTPTWQEFIDSNEAALSSWSDNKLALQLQAGAVVSRSDFLQVLRSELESAKVEMDERMRGDIQKMGDDVLKKSLAESGLHLDKTVKEAHSKVVVSPAASSASKVDWLGSGDVPSLLTSMIESALLKYSKDTLAMADFALWTAGGRIMPSITSDTFEYAIPRWGGLLKSKIIPGRPPATALHPNINVGECWPFAGSRGQLGILLARRVHVTDITVEHAAREVSFDMAAAPRDIEVWGLVEGQENLARVADYHASLQESEQTPSLPPSPEYILLGSFAYDIDSPKHIQTFAVPQAIQELEVDIGIVVARINSNYGEEYTCLYRVRVHGDVAPDPPHASE